MDIRNGDYASALDKLTAHHDAAASPSPELIGEQHTNPIHTGANDTLAQEHGLGPVHPRASRHHPPAQESHLISLKAPRSRWQRATAALGVFLLGQALGMLYVGLVTPGEPDTVYSAITALTWLGPLVAWFALRHRHLGQRQIQGYPPKTLAAMSAGMAEPWIELVIPDDDLGYAGDDASGHPAAPPSPYELAINEDLLVYFGGVYVRAKSALPAPASHARGAISLLQRAMAAELGLASDQVLEMKEESTYSADIDPEIGAHIDHLSLAIKRGQAWDTDELCEGIIRAVNTLRVRYDLILGD
ncbi:MAG: hypothetical protein WAV91_08665 [Aquabacterium sp.]